MGCCFRSELGCFTRSCTTIRRQHSLAHAPGDEYRIARDDLRSLFGRAFKPCHGRRASRFALAEMSYAVGELLAVPAIGAIAAWFVYRRANGSANQADPGRQELINEYFAPGTLVLELPLDNGGTLQVTSHAASERDAPGSPMGSFEEWRCLRFLQSGGLIQSVTKVVVSPHSQLAKMRGAVVPLAYTKSFATVVLAALSAVGAPVRRRGKEQLRILCIGLGGGSVPSFIAEGLPHCQVDVVELEPAVIHAAKQGMGFSERPNLRVIQEDGAMFALRAVKEQAHEAKEKGLYDAVLVDAYEPNGNVPAALWSRGEGLAEALAGGLLRPQGVVATNFLPHVDLAAPLAAYGNALANRPGISFSIQVNKAIKLENDLEQLFETVEGTGNRIAVHACGLSALSEAELEERLLEEAKKVGKETSCLWDMPDLACRGLRTWKSEIKQDNDVDLFTIK